MTGFVSADGLWSSCCMSVSFVSCFVQICVSNLRVITECVAPGICVGGLGELRSETLVPDVPPPLFQLRMFAKFCSGNNRCFSKSVRPMRRSSHDASSTRKIVSSPNS